MTDNVFDESTLTELAAGRLVIRKFVTFYFDEGTEGVWSDAGAIEVNDVTYRGDCSIAGVSGICGRSDFSMSDASIVLNGADPTVADWFNTSKAWHLRRIDVMGLLFDGSMRSVFATPAWRGIGLMEQAPVQESESQAATITIKVADFLQRSVIGTEAFFTDGSQKARLSTDTLLRYMSTIERPEDVLWGKNQSTAGNQQVHGLPITKG